MAGNKERIVFDANFFICMNSVKARNILGNLAEAGKDLDYEYYISEVVFDEIKAPLTFKEKFKRIINVEQVNDSEIEQIKNGLSRFKVRFPAQDPDLSLIFLSKKLLDKDDSLPVHLVTDDFKLAKNAGFLYRGKINLLSLSSFLLKIQRTATKAQMRKYFKNIWKKSLNYTLGYAIERSKVYPAEQKPLQ